jgi:hypothetical protein
VLEGVGMPTILPPAPNVLMVAILPPMPTMNLTTKPLGTMLNRLLESENRANKWAKKEIRRGDATKSCKWIETTCVEVTKKGKIDGACASKNVCDDMSRSTTTRYSNVSIVHVREHNQMDMETLRAKMDGLFSIRTTHYVKGVLKTLFAGFERRKVLLQKKFHQTRTTNLPIGYRATPMETSYEILDK